MGQLEFRAATQADLPFIIGLIVAGAIVASGDDPAHATDPGYVAAFTAIEADPNQELVVAELNGEPVGTLQLTFLPGLMRRGMWRGLIESVFIAPERRNQGLGSDMIHWAVERCRAHGCGLVQLTSNKLRTDAHRFYRRLGFEQSHEGFKLKL